MASKKLNYLSAFGGYDDFSIDRYFVLKHNRVPSQVELSIPTEIKREKLDAFMQLLDPDAQELQLVYKHQELPPSQKVDPQKEFPVIYLYEHAEWALMLECGFRHEHIKVEIYYDHREAAAEEWAHRFLNEVRAQMGKKESPTFKVLSVNRGGYHTKNVDVDPLDLDIDRNYNEDFRDIDATIREALNEERSGIILFHGPPGTGKTSYIKHLMYRHAETKFIFVSNNFVKDLLSPDFVTFLLTQKDSVLIIEDAEKVITSRSKLTQDSVVSTILQLTDGLFSDYLNLKIICTFNTDAEQIDQALFRKGRMIAFYEFRPLSVEKSQRLLDETSKETATEPMTLAEIYNPEERGFRQEKKTIGF